MIVIGKKLISGFLALVVSSLMFLASPAIAATSSDVATLTPENFETEVVQSDKPVVVILISDTTREAFEVSLDKLKSEAQTTFGDNYKIVLGTVEANPETYYQTPVPRIYPPISTATIYEKGTKVASGFFINPNDPKQAFESIKEFNY
ncbi:hypothetical protein Cylst_6064 [Cylindrospermum stagnale PCC 7417]|uniref:Uncharacterized protein n=1 Tax=Cylindrospermum stagnale PCC 7417 TaxID=56107 RepID=K9X7G7_9NOST|nr:hypothetical protein [Cylindrospermum stagnale]AFZ28036.1 hypothetical protein Cylst_6064 [Cylindrospermum stagnale PCC 7417]